MTDPPTQAPANIRALALTEARAGAQTLFDQLSLDADPENRKIRIIEECLQNLCMSVLDNFTETLFEKVIAKTMQDTINDHYGMIEEKGHEGMGDLFVGAKNRLIDELQLSVKEALVEAKGKMEDFKESDEEDAAQEGDARENMDIDEHTPPKSKTASDTDTAASSPYNPADDPGRSVRASDGKTERFNPLNALQFPTGSPQSRPPQP